jgi:hemerythrin-like domain-containing protein
MLPIGALMMEHRVIEKSLKLMTLEKKRMDNGKIDNDVVRSLVEFLTVFADKSHHGKEEAILFPALKGKSQSYEFDEITSNLMKEHASIRKHLRTIQNALQWFSEGDRESAETISRELGEIVDIYTRHVVKEDGPFFQSAMKSLSEEEKEDMLCAMQEFDLDFTINHYEKMVDEKYTALIGSTVKGDNP